MIWPYCKPLPNKNANGLVIEYLFVFKNILGKEQVQMT